MLISCIMPTRGRQEFAAAALDCYLSQTWRDKELIILDDADAPSFPGGVELFGVVYERMAHRLTIGAKRNIAVSRSQGEVIAHFDSDDYSAPGRLKDQMDRLIDGGAQVSGYNSMRFTDGVQWWQYTGVEDYALGTSLVYRRAYWERSPFPCEMVGEDTAFIVPARSSREIVTADAGEFMWATIHDGNTSPRDVTKENAQWRKIEQTNENC